MSRLIERELSDEEERENNQAVVAHLIPFVSWLTMLVWLDDPAWNYTVRTIGGLVLLLMLRPWRWYPRLCWKNVPLAIGVGILIFLVWVGFESAWMVQSFPLVTEWYDRLFVDLTQPFGLRELYDRGDGSQVPFMVIEEGVHAGRHVYDPRVNGWLSFSVQMVGTSVIIAMIEEFFYRGFIYRWMQGSPFYEIDAGRMSWILLIVVSVFFAVSHVEWGAAILCGIAFGWLYIKTKDIWAAIIAHGVTNFILGWYVVLFDAYQYW